MTIAALSNERLDEIEAWALSEQMECAEDDLPVSAQYFADVAAIITELLSLRSSPAVDGVGAADFAEVDTLKPADFSLRRSALSPTSDRASVVEECAKVALHYGGEANMLQNDNVDREENTIRRDAAYDIERAILALLPRSS